MAKTKKTRKREDDEKNNNLLDEEQQHRDECRQDARAITVGAVLRFLQLILLCRTRHGGGLSRRIRRRRRLIAERGRLHQICNFLEHIFAF